MKDRQQLDNIELQLSRVLNSSDGQRPFTLRLTDRDSGVLIAQCSLNEEAFADLMSSSIAHCSGHVATTDQYAHVGATRTVRSEKVPDEVTRGLHGSDDEERAAHEWALGRAAELPVNSFHVRRNRGGWQATFSTWTRNGSER